MRNRFQYSLLGLAAALAFSSFAFAQDEDAQPANQNRNAGSARNASGKAADDTGGPAPIHDLSGMWRGPGEALLSNRVPPLTPAGQAQLKLNIPDPFSASSNDPWKICDPFGMPRSANNQIAQLGFSQMPGRIIILEGFRTWREVWMDGRQLPKNIGHEGGPSTTYFGYSKGHWEGEKTLVVDTIGMYEKTWVDRRGYPHSTDAHVIERYTRTDHNHLTFTETVEDPAYYTEPFLIAKGELRWVRGQDDPSVAQIPFAVENLCVPSEAIEYMKLIGEPADEDKAVGNKTNTTDKTDKK
jgi:hypothetical protein